jgi:hypothetical protein
MKLQQAANAIVVVLLLALTISAQTPQAVDTSNAYRSARAREVHTLARTRRRAVDRSITNYQALAKERISVGLRTRLRDRLFYRRETASRIDWQRGGPINITVLGAREAVPVASSKAQVPGDLENFLPRLAFDPMDMDALLRIDTTTLKHPLSLGAEAHYRFGIGDSLSINLGERTIRLIELQVEPRRRDFHLVSGSFWIDSDTYSLVQSTFRLAKDFNFEEDAEDEEDRREANKIPGFMKPIRAELQYITIEYSLVHLRWWMPRLFAIEGMFQMGPIRTPIHYERSYTDYNVRGDTTVGLIARDSMTEAERRSRTCRPRTRMNVSISTDDDKPTAEEIERRRQREAVRDSARERERAEQIAGDTARQRRIREIAADTARQRRIREAEECAKLFHVTVEDSAKLLTSAELPNTIYGDTEELTSDPELAKLMEQLKRVAQAPWQLPAPSFSWGLSGNGLVRYNKVEALSVGGRGELDLGRLRADATARIGVGDWEPNFELGLTRATLDSNLRLAGYRRLEVMDKISGFGGMSSSLGALLNGLDERDYYRTLGGELVVRPAETSTQWYTLRLFGETQRTASKETDFSVRHLIDESHRFDPNQTARRADQLGAALTLRGAWGQNPAGFRLAAEAFVEGSTGTFDFVRESLLLQLGLPLPLKLAGAIEVAAGTTHFTEIADALYEGQPAQSLWYLGGTRTIRGYGIGDGAGTAFWRARGEIGTGLPLARLTLFTDVGWAGSSNHIAQRASLWSAGVGASFLDGLLRVDVARALRGSKDWRLHMSVDGIL